MKYDEFIQRVQERAHISSQSEAERATQATLETLAAYISPKERHDAASQLPKRVKEYLQRPASRPHGNGSLDDFYHRVSVLEGVLVNSLKSGPILH